MGPRPWLLSGLAGLMAFLGLSFLSVDIAEGQSGWLSSGEWAGIAVRVGVALLVMHAVFWWRATEHAPLSALGYGFLLGSVFFLVVFDARLAHPLRCLSGVPGVEGEGAEQACRAWQDFRDAPWRSPWTVGEGGEESDLGSLTASGMIPLIAIPAKVLGAKISVDFQYFGIWLLISYALQGVFAALLMRCLTHDPRLQMLGAGLFVMSPILLNSTAYPASAAHWLLLAGLWLYFRTVAAGRQGWAWLGWVILGIVAVAVHGQLALIVLLLGATFVARCIWVDETIGFARGLLEVAILVSTMAIVGFVVGYSDWRCLAGNPSDSETGLSGAMNLAGPIDPAGWSSFLKPWTPVSGAASAGFAYLGAGVLVLVLWCWLMIVTRPLDASGFRPWIPLLGLGVVLTLLAVLPRVAVGRYVLVDLGEIPWVSSEVGLLAGMGRFFWLVTYATLFLLIALVVHAHPPRRAVLLLAFVLTLQVADLREQLGTIHGEVRGSLAAEDSANIRRER